MNFSKGALHFLLVTSIVILPSTVSAATILTFDFGSGFGDRLPQTYGDNLVDTPNVDVSHRGREVVNGATGEAGAIGAFGGLSTWLTGGYGDLVNNAYYGDFSTGYYGEITLTADPGYEVILNSFELASYSSLAIHTLNQPVFIVEGLDGAVLANYSGTVPSSGHNSYSVGIARNTLTIRFGNNYNIGIDNVNFSQQYVGAVPEPGTMSLLGIGIASLFVVRWRRKPC